MDVQWAIEALNRRLQQLESFHSDDEYVQATYIAEQKNIQFTLSFWSLLQRVQESSSDYTLFLPLVDHHELLFDAVFLTPGGVYLYYLLPNDIHRLSVLPEKIIWSIQKKDDECYLGIGRKTIKQIQEKIALASLPVYEFYVVPDSGRNIRYVMEDTVILSFNHIPLLFENFVFREHPIHQESQTKLFQYLTASSTPPSVIPAIEALEESLPVEESKDEEIRVVDITQAIEKDSLLPPRQRRRKQKEGGWLSRLISREK
ncbi:hypothetical protein [Ammoniphilus sp. CFH 90114]|uniref:hypothetical protein n=1 Tax=Ammoniphilus sp. CFH 90114 TaxID=2493665 RepID=UPI00100FE412|nr:hypothetical protein [Ammoniphilus sp. CFH 90114]RXT15242.1 hypothetical protein EIZ39_03255 [Ammoniphilus sp. CFH 90114]